MLSFPCGINEMRLKVRMRHDWIFDVLTDLKAYAVANGMGRLAVKADEALVVARDEVSRLAEVPTLPPAGDAPPEAKSH